MSKNNQKILEPSLLINNLTIPYMREIKLIIFALIVGGLIAGWFLIQQHISSLKEDIVKLQTEKAGILVNAKVLQQNNDVLRENISSLNSANTTNLTTIQQLLSERSEALKAINNLASATVSDKQTIIKLNKKLEQILSDPKNDGIVSPALRETVREVQNIRK